MAKNTSGPATVPPVAFALLAHFLLNCNWFLPLADGFVSPTQTRRTLGSVSSSTELRAVKKRQTAIFDGAEFVSIASFLLNENPSWLARVGDDDADDDDGENGENETEGDDEPPMPEMRAGYMTIVAGTSEEEGEEGRRIVGVERPSSSGDDDDEVISLGGDTEVYASSVATIPKSVSDADAIATVAASLCGVHCGMPRVDGGGGKAVILGGGDYACFTAKALSELGAEVSLVTTRPMQLKDTPLNPLKDSDVNAMGPAIGEEELGFSAALGKFDSVIDTLGDEARLSKVSKLSDGIAKTLGAAGVAAKLKRDNGCDRYISTLTRSQKYVLEEGLFFARGLVLKYQEKAEKPVDPSKLLRIIPPREFGSATLQKLLDSGIVFSADKNENGENNKKDVFVRGWSFPDYTELEVWPRDNASGTKPVRYGFPGIGELALEFEVESMMGGAGPGAPPEAKPAAKKPKQQAGNPFVTQINGLSDLAEEIVANKRDCVLFVSASYCKLCKAMSPRFNRMARIATEEFGDSVVFAKANTASKSGKQLSFSLKVDSVPTFILFRDGERYGTSICSTKLPSEKLDLAIEYLRDGKEWDPGVFIEDCEESARTKLK